MPGRVRPDFSQFVAHFTRYVIKDDLPEDINQTPEPRDRLTKILGQKKIVATRMPWFGARAVAFTECTWTSLLDHADPYSSYGIGFHKDFLWQHGGGPAIYLRPNLYDAQAEYVGGVRKPFAESVRDFLTPISREPFRLRDGTEIETPIDYSHEREWRVPSDLIFEYADVAFVIVKDFDDVSTLPTQAVESIGKGRFLSMANYETVEGLWPILHIAR